MLLDCAVDIKMDYNPYCTNVKLMDFPDLLHFWKYKYNTNYKF